MSEGKLINPHGSDELKVLLLSGDEKNIELERAKSLKTVDITSRESGDLIMLGIGGFTPLDGFMGQDDWKSVTSDMQMSDGTFWPIPIRGRKEERSKSLVGLPCLQRPEP